MCRSVRIPVRFLLSTLFLVAGILVLSAPMTAQRRDVRSGGSPSGELVGTIAQDPSALAGAKLGTVRTASWEPSEVDASKVDLKGLFGQSVDATSTTTHGTSITTMSVSPEVVPINTTRAAVVSASGYLPGETVGLTILGGGTTNCVADANGICSWFLNSGGVSTIVLRAVGVTSGRVSFGATQVSASGPFIRPLAAVPHAVAPGGTFFFYGERFPPNAPVRVFRNGVLQAAAPVADANGRIQFAFTPANNGNTAAVYSVDVAAESGSLVGVSLEERTDAGVTPTADQNSARGFYDRPVVSSATTSATRLYGEGFVPNELVTLSNCGSGSANASGNGTLTAFTNLTATPQTVLCVLTGASGRVARAAIQASPNATNSRSLLVAPGVSVLTVPDILSVMGSGVAPGTATASLDGVNQGPVSVGGDGSFNYGQSKPGTSGLHYVTLIDSAGRETSAAFYLLASPTAASVAVSGRVVDGRGNGVRGARVTITDSRGNTQTAVTSALGYYRFSSVTAGDSYVANVASRGFIFGPRVITISDSIAGLDFRPE